MVEKLLNYYKTRNNRERIMLWCVVVVLFGVWASYLLEKTSTLNKNISNYENQIDLANVAIQQGPHIQKALEQIQKSFDSSKTLSPVALQIAVENAARKSDLVYSLSNPVTKDAGKFKINTITLSCQRCALKNLAAFEKNMTELEPYVTFSRATFDGANTGDVTAKYEISSFEFN